MIILEGTFEYTAFICAIMLIVGANFIFSSDGEWTILGIIIFVAGVILNFIFEEPENYLHAYWPAGVILILLNIVEHDVKDSLGRVIGKTTEGNSLGGFLAGVGLCGIAYLFHEIWN